MENVTNISSFFAKLIVYCQRWYQALSGFAETVILWLFTPLKDVVEKIPNYPLTLLDNFLKVVAEHSFVGNITVFEIMCGSLVGLFLALVVIRFILSFF